MDLVIWVRVLEGEPMPKVGERYIWPDRRGILEVVSDHKMKVVVPWPVQRGLGGHKESGPVWTVNDWWPNNLGLILLEGQDAPK